MSLREIPSSGYDNDTMNKILDVATQLFAIRGFGSVSMRDIAKEVGIKMSSIYYYYEGKEALLEDVLLRFERGYRHYFKWLTDANEKVNTLEELSNNMFNKEFIEVLNPMGCFGMSIVIKEQHSNEQARKCVFELFYDYSISLMKSDFDRLIQKGVIPPTDTKMLAAIFMFAVIACNDIRVHEYTGTKPPIDCITMYNDLKKMIISILRNGYTS